MSNPADFPYVTRLDILYPSLAVIDEKALSDACEHRWFNQTLLRRQRLCRAHGRRRGRIPLAQAR